MNKTNLLVNLGILFSLGSLLSCSAMDPYLQAKKELRKIVEKNKNKKANDKEKNPTTFNDLPDILQVRILLEAKPELKQWLIVKNSKKLRIPTYSTSTHNYSLAITPDGKNLITGSRREAIIWDIKTGKPLKHFERELGNNNWIDCLSITPDSDKIITSSEDNTVLICNIKKKVPNKILQAHDRLLCLAITPNGKKIITGYSDNDALIWDIKTGLPLKILHHQDPVTHLAVTPDSKKVVTISLDEAIIWDIETGDQFKNLKDNWINCLSITPDGKKIITGSIYGRATIWDIKTGTLLKILQGQNGNISCLPITPDNKKVVTYSEDKTAIIWDIETENQLTRLQGTNNNYISCIAITPDSKNVITGSQNGTTIIWDIETGKQLATLEGHDDVIDCLAITPNGKNVITGSQDATVIIRDWYINNIAQLIATCEGLSSRELAIVELAHAAAQNGKKLRLPKSLWNDFEKIAQLIKERIQEYVVK